MLIWVFKRISRFSYRVHIFLWYFEKGMQNDYPLCCIAHFSWNAADPKFKKIGPRGQAMGPAVYRGAVHIHVDKVYVPCWFHLHIRRHPNWRAYQESPPHHPHHPKLFYIEPILKSNKHQARSKS